LQAMPTPATQPRDRAPAGLCTRCRRVVFQCGLVAVAVVSALLAAACVEYVMAEEPIPTNKIKIALSALGIAIGVVAAAMGPPCDPIDRDPSSSSKPLPKGAIKTD